MLLLSFFCTSDHPHSHLAPHSYPHSRLHPHQLHPCPHCHHHSPPSFSTIILTLILTLTLYKMRIVRYILSFASTPLKIFVDLHIITNIKRKMWCFYNIIIFWG